MSLTERTTETYRNPENDCCRDCGAEEPLLVEFTEQRDKRLWLCESCYLELSEDAPTGIYGARVIAAPGRGARETITVGADAPKGFFSS